MLLMETFLPTELYPKIHLNQVKMTFHQYKSIPFDFGFRLKYSPEEIFTISYIDRQPIKIILPFLYQENFDTHHKEMWTYENPTKSRNSIF